MLSRLPTIGLADKTNYNNIKTHFNPKKGTVLAFDSQRTIVDIVVTIVLKLMASTDNLSSLFRCNKAKAP